MPAGGRAGQRFQSGGLTFARQSGDAGVRIGPIRLPAFRPLPAPDAPQSRPGAQSARRHLKNRRHL